MIFASGLEEYGRRTLEVSGTYPDVNVTLPLDLQGIEDSQYYVFVTVHDLFPGLRADDAFLASRSWSNLRVLSSQNQMSGADLGTSQGWTTIAGNWSKDLSDWYATAFRYLGNQSFVSRTQPDDDFQPLDIVAFVLNHNNDPRKQSVVSMLRKVGFTDIRVPETTSSNVLDIPFLMSEGSVSVNFSKGLGQQQSQYVAHALDYRETVRKALQMTSRCVRIIPKLYNTRVETD